MKKVSIGEKLFVMFIIGLLSFLTTYLGGLGMAGAALNGIGWGLFGAAFLYFRKASLNG